MSTRQDAAMDDPVRVDRWLWAARLFKTRSLATEAVRGGRVHVNGRAAKPSRELRPGERVEITVGSLRRTLIVRATAERRGPAREAALLYDETPESVEARERAAAERRAAGAAAVDLGGRPRGRDRRRYERAARGRRGG
jgi:ribosome-associated heat shock protein Hsp15